MRHWGAKSYGFDPGAGFFDAVRQDPVLAGVKLIAEPWDVGPGGYQLGNHPPGFAEWNDRFRDGVRRFWRGDPGQRPEIAARLAGSADFFAHQWTASLGFRQLFVAAHDGFTLQDVVSYVERHNEANGEDNQDGHPANFTSNWGVEGPHRRSCDQRTCVIGSSAPCWPPCSWPRARRCCWPATNSAARSTATTTPIARTTRLSWLDWQHGRQPGGDALTIMWHG